MNVNLAHLHLLLNHVPTIGTVIGLGLFFVSLVGRNDSVKKASLVILLMVAAAALPVYITGNAANEIVQNRVSKELVAKHQDAAALALAFMAVTGIFAWLGLWQYRRDSRPAGWTMFAILLVSVVTLGLMTQAATLGGEIRHEEIRSAEDAAAGPGVVASIGQFVLDHSWVWPTCETVHYIGLCLLFGTVLAINLRLLGMMKSVQVSALRGLLPWGLLGFGLNVISGMLFFVATPTQYTQNVAFHWKIIFMVLAGLNTLYLTFDESWRVEEGSDAPFGAKVMAAVGILAWFGVLYMGRMLPYIGNSF
ncbi:MAG TPA: hypothetical protein VER98_19865 [Terriglobia bacterium]|nr:hypothetical protein [Terriglobia bacterium]